MSATAVLLLTCADQRGVVAATAEFIARHSGNIVHAEQHVDPVEGVFFQRVEFELASFGLERSRIADAFDPIATAFKMQVDLRFSDSRARIAVLASRQPHCLYDLLTRWRTGELDGEIVTVISNHDDHADLCGHLGVEYVHLPVTVETRASQAAALHQILDDRSIDLVVLARYMQILPPAITEAYAQRIINIHHSFLPAFIGANPYRQAYDRGVKLIGATAHYATEELDDGPIIAQETAHVSHRDDVSDLTRKGRDLETIVLARAVRAHLEHRILVYGHKTVVFEG